jgi:uncharacterized protein (DUF1800 family)
MGPKHGAGLRLGDKNGEALKACLGELEDPAAALLDDPSLPTPEDRARELAIPGNRTGVHLLMNRELEARYAKHVEPEVGVVERLVRFWSSHFSLNAANACSPTAWALRR